MAAKRSMFNENEKKPEFIKMTKRTLKYIFETAWKEKKIVYLLFAVKFIAGALGEFKLLLLPKLLIDEVEAISQGTAVQEHLHNAIIYVAFTIAAEFLSNVLMNIADSKLNYYSTYFDRPKRFNNN